MSFGIGITSCGYNARERLSVVLATLRWYGREALVCPLSAGYIYEQSRNSAKGEGVTSEDFSHNKLFFYCKNNII